MPVPHAADAGSVDVVMLRRSWTSLLEHLGQMARPQPVLRALLEPATPASFDGSTLELAFPPSGGFGVQRVMDRQDVLKQALTRSLRDLPADRLRRPRIARPGG